ncbi:MAG: type II toxin-antitoxin system HicB family antitoxin [Limisphaerales bacterium]
MQFTAIIERGEKYLMASCPEVPEANGQGLTREEVLQDLTDSIQSVLEYKRETGLSLAAADSEKTAVTIP